MDILSGRLLDSAVGPEWLAESVADVDAYVDGPVTPAAEIEERELFVPRNRHWNS